MTNKNVSNNKDHVQNIREQMLMYAKIIISPHQMIKDVSLLIINVLNNLRLVPFMKAKL